MNIEYAVILSILHTRDLKAAIATGIKPDYFALPDALLAFKLIEQFAATRETFGQVPSIRWLSERVPSIPYNTPPMPDTTSALIYELKDSYLTRQLSNGLDDLDMLVRTDPRMAVEYLITTARNLQRETGDAEHLRMDIMDAATKAIEAYALLADNDGMLGIPYPWDPLNEATRGMQKGEYIVIYGPPKNMKTWIANEMGTVFPFEYANARCLMISCEMPIPQMFRRTFSRLARVNYGELVSSSLRPEDRSRFEQTCLAVQAELMAANASSCRQRNIRIIKPSVRTGGGISSIRAAIEEFEPDVVLIDGVYLLKDERNSSRNADWKNIAHINQDLKGVAHEYQIPIIGTTQANRSGMRRKAGQEDVADDLAFSMSALMDADVVIRVQKVITTEGDTKVILSLPAVRESTINQFMVNANPSIDFSLHSRDIDPQMLERLMGAEPTVAKKSAPEPRNNADLHDALSRQKSNIFGKR